MVLFNHATREMTAKIVYYGPGLCGKTTNLLVIFDKLDPNSRGKMLSLATKTDRTLFFDLLPVDIGKVGPFNLKIQLYTVPGQVFYNETRKLVLKGADSVVFVADSQPSMIESNRQSFENLMENLQENQIDANDLPIVIQYNKRDIPGVLPVEQLQEKLGFEGYPYVEAAAVQGQGVMETFKLVSKITAKHLLNRVQGKSKSPEEAAAERRREAEKLSVRLPKSEPAAQVGASPAEPEFIAPVESPFDISVPQESYERVEEVSLESLLEGRDRPATFAGNVAVPVMEEDVESLEEQQMIDSPIAVVADEPDPMAAEAIEEPSFSAPAAVETAAAYDDRPLRRRIDDLQRDLERLQDEQRRTYQLLSDIATAIIGALPREE